MKPASFLIALTLLTSAVPALVLAAPAPLPTADEKAAVAWIESAGHRLATAEPSADELAPLAARLADARVVGIGEATHGTHEDQAFKAALIRALVRAGKVNALALEANRTAGYNFDRYVRFGEGDPVTAILDKSFFKIWRDDEFASLLLWLRAWNLANPTKMVRVFSIDLQDAGRDAAFALALVARHDAVLARSLRIPFADLIPEEGGVFPRTIEWSAKVKPEDYKAATAGARALEDALEAHRADWQTDPDYAEARYAAHAAWQMFPVFESTNAQVEMSKMTPEDLSQRDHFMADNLLARLQADDHAVFWAHDSHVCDSPVGDDPPGGYAFTGALLKAKLGNAYRAVGFTWSRATISITKSADLNGVMLKGPQAEEPVALPNDRPGELGGVFARASGDALWIDLAARPHNEALDHWMRLPYYRGYVGWLVDPAKWQNGSDGDEAVWTTERGFDVLVWFRTMTPSHRLPSAPPPPAS